MDLFSELVAAVQSDLTVGSESTLFPATTIKLAINRAYRKVAGLFRWPETEDAKKTSTVASQEYYDFPQTWRSDSIWRLEVDGDQYGEIPDGSPMAYDDYLVWRADEDNANSTDKKWAVQRRRYFIYPVPTANGTNNVTVWGQRVPDALAGDGDITIFSYSMPEGNEAIVLEAGAILKAKGEQEKSSGFKSAEAKQILIVAWGKIRQEQAKYEKVQPFFNVSDMFGKTKVEDVIGNF